MMRICHLSSINPASHSRIFHKECKSLAKVYHTTLITPHERDEDIDGVRIRGVPKPRWGRIHRMTKTVWQVYRKAFSLNVDLYHFHDPELIPAGLLLRLQGRKVIFDIMEDIPASIVSKYYLPRWSRGAIRLLIKFIEKSFYRFFSALISSEPDVRDQISKLNKTVVLVQNFPPVEEMATSEGISWNQRKSIAYVGAISAIRGICEMVKAMSYLIDSSSVTLKLGGSFDPENLMKEVSILPGWKRVDYLGYLDRKEIRDILSCSFAGLVVLYPDPNHVLAYPVKMFEYMSAGIPVIASDFPLWRQIVEGARCGLLVDPLEPKAIAKAICYLNSHPKEAEEMGARGREAVEKCYNWKKEEAKLLNLYEEILLK
jgi:glycosyltransferase involved in cell wall biosynthesis